MRHLLTNCFPVLVLLSLPAWLAGCDSLRQEVDPSRLNREASRLVVTSFLSPQDTVLAVKISRSQPVLGEEASYGTSGNSVPDATVTLSDGTKVVALTYNARQAYYRADIGQLPIRAGRTYTLLVQTPDGERAESSCTIPGPVALMSIVYDSLTENRFGQQSRRYFARGLWVDPAGQANYYQVTGKYEFLVKGPNLLIPRQMGLLSFNDEGNSLKTDQSVDGKEMVSNRAFMRGVYYSNTGQVANSNNQFQITSITMNLLSTDQAYYRYQDAVSRQAEVSGNPFAEPVPVPSNIRGGLGCFAGYNRSTLILQLK
ncbi:DUF4249 domain-containing protein [Spirosoma taeanense]|uniref:DUF4249 domain-containing protein n=1 Tax=Spirosoma taeanense TaxID=2735870 RepID=A0A6M5Y5P9_9BACT|nr:DUF4249 domain-containing protein [Spirosoma taeanense]QJW88022.1 DUF4249 domain-containing protein [Spirosoma taeanense]